MKKLFVAVCVAAPVAAGVIALNWPHHPWPTEVIRAVAVNSDPCGTFGNWRCHFVATSDGRVLEFDPNDESWVAVLPGHCYRVNDTDNGLVGAREVACP